ncbi:head-tail adaptor protein [Hyphomicrobiaceae bacterium 22]|uniref:Head-tail adaptor protein n=1 Tax=Prosthecodimorpha staleyi TaxID=2840188 RepID=A0A947GAH4_9HYPH|nr:head-tail adaptor protein [Prosthecodimorpha staleyi]MBT9289128.1 head-tail adaptor protein [Prosthecodimorpha staleyi]
MVTLERATTAPSGDTVWTADGTLRAGIEPVGAGERDLAGHVEGTATHRILLNGRAAVTSRDRLALGERRFRILAAYDPDETGRWLVCLAEEASR